MAYIEFFRSLFIPYIKSIKINEALASEEMFVPRYHEPKLLAFELISGLR
jgi:hypothetical protein